MTNHRRPAYQIRRVVLYERTTFGDPTSLSGTASEMLGLSLCDGRRDGRPDDQVATVITEMRIARWRNAGYEVAPGDLLAWCIARRTVLPALFLDQMLHFRRAVTRMLRSVRSDLLLTVFAPGIVTTCLWTFQVLCFFELLLIEKTGAGTPAALQTNQEL